MARFFASAADVVASDCTGPCCGVTRRSLLRGLAAGVAASALATPSLTGRALAQAPQAANTPKRRVIDMHHHFFPDAFKASSAQEAPLPPFVRDWSPARMLEEMDKNNIEQSVLSLASVPQQWFRDDNDKMRKLIREMNDYGAKLVQDHKGRHGLFAYVSPRDVDGALAEIAYAFDTLKADGIEMSTNFGDKWPGDPAFAAIFQELNRRKAIVYFHPLSPFCCGNLVPNIGDSWTDYPADSSRAILSLMFNGTFAKNRDIRCIFSHSGGTMPYLAHRVDWQSRPVKNRAEVAPDGVIGELRKLYYETANAASAPTMAALTKLVPMSQIMYGSDFPYVTNGYNLENLRGAGIGGDDLATIEYRNAERLIPRLKA